MPDSSEHSTHPNGHVLVVLSGADSIPLKEGHTHPTGHFLGEVTEPLEALLNAGHRLTFTSPSGKSPTIDQNSYQLIYWGLSKSNLDNAKAVYQHLVELGFESPHPLEELVDLSPECDRPTPQPKLEPFDAVFIPGGHAPMVDLLHTNFFTSDEMNPYVGELLYFFHRTQRPTGLICHAPAVLAAAPSVQGTWIYSGYKMTAITMLSEFIAEDLPLMKTVGGHLKEYPTGILKNAGATLEQSLIPMVPKVVEDRELLTGQDPYSAKQFGEQFVQKLNVFLADKCPADKHS
ncbi:MAG: type 1 glutamine amidotransferase domain-containing protein [Leptolyngbyaceae bacterium]|nr:type 1 glutamine amidotransferase domain-containing protein [Leptolyngbyaceae bacterium]